ncbi:bifunctional aspartate kinase/homoserine dehydrogenase I [Arcticibacterium luteifluviistationis]|uniref:Bifunctional aspartate kinase/homoserine dehydrogenase I n=1 Tax=Arcticibacterium luteifluviistationis TaxID=1784714 RepID=A0A2Z4GAW4_9BACT|nr:bifunctional aspartate kinase/homoserine dehydrogenase I [Arcticibacterium luteifluviistationis]AWV98218.1 bifunctional aspartate kinase/homoserine dehydrogenase I [Arcticibacterium luteifluviistationis]
MKVLKFGGTSVGTVESINKVLAIIEKNVSEGNKIAVVFSAMGGVTNRFIEIGKMAAEEETEYMEHLHSVEERHFNAIRRLIDVKQQSELIAKVKVIFNEIEDLLRGISLIQDISPRTMDLLLSFGERLSTTIISATLNKKGIDATFVDARKLIKTDSNFNNASVQIELTNKNIQEFAAENKGVLCITGFVSSNDKGVTTTLGRGGSDYTASIFGAALNAEIIEIWTDVNGMMTADPRKVKNAFTIPDISYAEAMELSHFGAKVIYPPSLTPAFLKQIPVKVLNTFNAEHPGTTVSKVSRSTPYSITGISSIDDIALVNLEGNGMIGVAGTSAKVFGILADHNISVIFISQASSEHSICFAVNPSDSNQVETLLNEGFQSEIESGDIDKINVQPHLSILAVVGEGMKSSSGTSGKLFSVLGQNGINVVGIAQGSSELNISIVINRKDISKALNAIHERFFEIDGFTLNVFLVGPTGLIGKTLLSQIENQAAYLKKHKNTNIKIVGLINSRKMMIDAEGLSLEDWEENLNENGEKANLSEFISDVKDLNLPNTVFVDSTANKDIVQHYAGILENNISIITPNKVANSGSQFDYDRLQKIANTRNVQFLYETNVGAGLPIINTLQGLINSGDEIHQIEAVLSGTLAYIFNNFDVGKKFVDVVKEAKEMGYTEPDPREDLSGMDVARKILILARESGLQLEPSDVELTPLLSENCMAAASVEDFYVELEKENATFEKLINDAKSKGQVLRYIAKLNKGKASIALETVDKNHPFYALAGSENIISFTTSRYKTNPLVVKGPGAGAEVTAMGVFADIISLSSSLN